MVSLFPFVNVCVLLVWIAAAAVVLLSFIHIYRRCRIMCVPQRSRSRSHGADDRENTTVYTCIYDVSIIVCVASYLVAAAATPL